MNDNGTTEPADAGNIRALPGVKLEADPVLLRALHGLAAAAELGELKCLSLVFLRSDGNIGTLRYCPTEPHKMLGAMQMVVTALSLQLAQAEIDETPPPPTGGGA